MPDFHLISHHLCPYVQRAVIVLIEKEIPHERSYIDLANKPEWFSDISPLGKVPVLQTGSSVLFESQVIAEYLDEITAGSLHPADPLEKARHRSWIEFASGTLNAIGELYNAPDREAFEEKRAALKVKFESIEPEISGPFFSGNTFHMIDGVWGTVFRYLAVFDTISDFARLNDLKATQIWRDKISTRASVIGATPEGYAKRLKAFLRTRDSYISTLMK